MLKYINLQMNPNLKFALVFSLLLLIGNQGFAQKAKAKKSNQKSNVTRVEDKDGEISVEFNIDDGEGDNRTMTLGSDGALVYYTIKDKTVKKSQTYEMVKFDKDLNEEYRTKYSFPAGYDLIFTREENSKIYFLVADEKGPFFSVSSVNSSFVKKYAIIRFDPIKNEFKKFDGNITSTGKGAYIMGFHISNDVAYMNIARGKSPTTISTIFCLSYCACFLPVFFGATNPRLKPDVIIHNLDKKGNQRIVNLGYDKRKGSTVIVNSSIDDSLNTSYHLLVNSNKKSNTFWIKGVGQDGKMSKDIPLKIGDDKIISEGNIASIDDKKIVYGMYAGKPKKITFGTSSYGLVSQGVFFSVFSDNKVEKITFTPYTKLKLALSKSTKKAVKKNEKKNKETNIYTLVHYLKPLQYNDEVILVGEMYYATFRTEYYMDGNGKMRSRQVFDGWAFSNILFVAYDLKGNLLWNHVIGYDRPKSFTIYDRVQTTLNEEGIVEAVYSDGFFVKSVKVNKDGVQEGTKSYRIGSAKSGDKIKAAGTSGTGANVEYWYDEFYLASGIQEIKNKQLKGKEKKREVYYLKKVEIE